jgi:hypothetical protein
MNSTHVAVATGSIVGSTTATDKLTLLLTGFHGTPADKASALAWFAVNGCAALYAVGYAVYRAKWPAAAAPVVPPPVP